MSESLDESMTGVGDPAGRVAAYLDARQPWADQEGVDKYDGIAYLSEPFDVQLNESDLRAVLAENASLRAQRDAMERALNHANAELHASTIRHAAALNGVGLCGATTVGLLGNLLRPCLRESGHPGGHRNIDGTEWRERTPDPLEATDAWSRAQAEDDRREPAARYPAANWLIYSHGHGAWWRPFEHGYASSLAEAGRYLHPRAEQICRDANAYGWVNGLPNEVMIEWTDDPQAAAAAVRQATAVLVTERATQEAPGA